MRSCLPSSFNATVLGSKGKGREDDDETKEEEESKGEEKDEEEKGDKESVHE